VRGSEDDDEEDLIELGHRGTSRISSAIFAILFHGLSPVIVIPVPPKLILCIRFYNQRFALGSDSGAHDQHLLIA
jgi:hypothetical protein